MGTQKNFNKIIKFDASDLIDVETLDEDVEEITDKKPEATVKNESSSTTTPSASASSEKKSTKQKTYGSVRNLPENASLGGVRRIGDPPIQSMTAEFLAASTKNKVTATPVQEEKTE